VDAFRAALAQVPRNGWALWGLWQAMAATQAHPRDIAAVRAAFERAWLGEPALLSLDRL
jgi:hypothetical protein